ncbi:hypothetical protein N7475_003007 [Penicillium sp. IBT 31633x]|nr:hypothetical protein N7475_003007 [Penicillium sp. IBT 31633x]
MAAPQEIQNSESVAPKHLSPLISTGGPKENLSQSKMCWDGGEDILRAHLVELEIPTLGSRAADYAP